MVCVRLSHVSFPTVVYGMTPLIVKCYVSFSSIEYGFAAEDRLRLTETDIC